MALVDFRFKKNEAVLLTELNDRLTIAASVQDDAGGNIVTVRADDTEEADLTEYMAEFGYSLIEGAGGVGVTGTASDDEDRRLLDHKNSVRVCTGGDDIAATWTASGSGRGKTLTSPDFNTSNNDFDGVTVAVGDRVLVKDGSGATAVHNGIYEVTQLADGVGQNTILRRAFDYDDDVEVKTGSNTFVLEGTTCALRTFFMTTAGPITVDTTQLVFEQGQANDASDSFVFGAGSVFNTTTTRYLFPGYSDSTAQTVPVQFRVPRAGTFQNLRVRHNQLGSSANTVTYTLRVNGTPSTLTVSLASNAADGNDLVNSVVVAAGDLIDIEVTKGSSITGALRDILASVEFTT